MAAGAPLRAHSLQKAAERSKSSCETLLQLLVGQWYPGKEVTVPVYQHGLLAQVTECVAMNLSDI